VAHGQTNWLSAPWLDEWQHHYKKLVPIILTVAMWGQQWSSLHIQFHSDNMHVVDKDDAQPTFLFALDAF